MKAILLRVVPRALCVSLRMLILVMLASAVAPTFSVRAASVIVDSLPDVTHSSGCAANGISPCSLRDAITYANTNAGIAISINAGTYNLTAGMLSVHVDMTIAGADAGTTIIDGGGGDRIFLVNGGNVAISQLTMRNGNANSSSYPDGGALLTSAAATVTLANVVISGNKALHGGGIAMKSSDTLTINDSAIIGNIASDLGGGLYNNTGTIIANRSLIANNAATGTSGGGGIYVSSTTTLNNTTVFGNNGPHGGAIAVGAGTLILSNATLSGNSASMQAGAIFNQGTATITNSIVADSCFISGGSFSSGDYNIDHSGTCGLHQSHDQTIDPMLDSLKDNGGPTQTLALLSGSPAIDKIPNVGANCPATDQRGTVRPQPAGGSCDIGAFEAAAIPAPTHFTIASPPSTTAGAPTSVTVTAKDAGEHAVPSYTGTIYFTSTDNQATLPAGYTFTGGGGDNGVHTFTGGVTFKVAGSQTLTVIDAAKSSIAGSAAITINPATAARFTVAGFPSPNVAGATGSFMVTALDAFGNTATGYTGTVLFSSSDPQADLPGTYSFVGGDTGTHTFTNGATLRTAGTQSITATDTVTASVTGSQSITVTSIGGVGSFVLTGYPSPASVNTTNGFTVIAKDAYGNTVPAYRGAVQFSSTDTAATLPGAYTFTAADSGVHLFTAVMKTVGSQTLTVADTTNGSIMGNQTLTVTAAAANRVAANTGTTPQRATVGVAFSAMLAVTVKDTYNNPVPGISVTFVAPGNGTRGLFGGGDAAVSVTTDGSGVATAPSFTANGIAGSYTVAVMVPGLATSTPFAMTNLPGPTTHFVLGAPASAVAGASFALTVTAADSFGNMATGYRGTIQLASTDAQADPPTNYPYAANDNGSHSFSVTLRSAGSRSITVTDTGSPSLTGSTTIQITTAPASIITANASSTPQTATISTAFGALLAATVRDAFGNPVSGVSVTFTAPGSTFSGTFAGGGTPTETTDVSGVATAPTFTANTTVGSYNVTASATGLTATTFSLTNTAGAPDSITANGNTTPQSAMVNTAFAALAVTVKDGANNAIPNISVTFIAPGNGASGAFTGSIYTVNVTTNASGIATAPTFAANTIAGAYSVSASALGVASPAIFSLTNTAGNAASLIVSTLPNPTQAGVVANFTITARDSSGNIALTYHGAVTFTSTDAAVMKPATYLFTAVDNGSHTFPVTFKTVGPQTITATDASLTGFQPTIVNPGPAATIAVMNYPSTTTVNTSGGFTVIVRDFFGNTASGYTGTVHFSSADSLATLPANYLFTIGDQGVHAFAATFKTVGTQTLIATDSMNSPVTGKQSGIAVTPAGVTHLAVTAPTNARAGMAFSLTMTAMDSDNNTVTGYTRTVRFTSSDPQAALPLDYTFVAADNGVHIFSVMLKVAGSQTITITDLSSGAITGAATVTVSGPTAASVTPGNGSTVGGTTITITGTNLTGASVNVGGAACTSVQVNNTSTSLTCVTSMHAEASVDVVVTTSTGSATIIHGFTYIGSGIAPAPGPRSGGGIGTQGGSPNPLPSHR